MWYFVKKKVNILEQQLIFKDDGDDRDGKSSEVFTYLFHFQSYKHVSILSLWLLAHA